MSNDFNEKRMQELQKELVELNEKEEYIRHMPEEYSYMAESVKQELLEREDYLSRELLTRNVLKLREMFKGDLQRGIFMHTVLKGLYNSYARAVSGRLRDEGNRRIDAVLREESEGYGAVADRLMLRLGGEFGVTEDYYEEFRSAMLRARYELLASFRDRRRLVSYLRFTLDELFDEGLPYPEEMLDHLKIEGMENSEMYTRLMDVGYNAKRCLKYEGIEYVRQLTSKTRGDLFRMRYMQVNDVRELDIALLELGTHLKQTKNYSAEQVLEQGTVNVLLEDYKISPVSLSWLYRNGVYTFGELLELIYDEDVKLFFEDQSHIWISDTHMVKLSDFVLAEIYKIMGEFGVSSIGVRKLLIERSDSYVG